MRICAGCGGILGRDCFNEMECISITHSQQSNLEYRVQLLEDTVAKLIAILIDNSIDVDIIYPKPIIIEPAKYSDDLPF